MSRSAVSFELFVSAAHFDVVSFPSKPSSSLLITSRWRSFSGKSRSLSQYRALSVTPESAAWAPSIARVRQPRNHSIQAVTSIVPRCVCSRMR